MRSPTPTGPDVTPADDDTPPAGVTTAAPLRRAPAGSSPPSFAPQRRHTVEEPIESGEIVERRSLVIRTRTAPVPDFAEEPTEVTPIAPVPEPRRGNFVILGAALACGVAGGALALHAKPAAPSPAALDAGAEMVGTTLDSEASAVMLRAQAIAASPILRAGIETDARTLADMAHGHDLVFPLRRGDVLEVFQVHDNTRTLMLRVPDGAAELARPKVGDTRIAAGTHGAVVVANAPVTKDQSNTVGEIVLSADIDLSPATTRLAGHATSAVLQGLGRPIALVDGAAPPNVTIPITTKSPVAGPLSLAAAVPQPTARRIYAWLCLGASLLLLSIFAGSAIRARRS